MLNKQTNDINMKHLLTTNSEVTIFNKVLASGYGYTKEINEKTLRVVSVPHTVFIRAIHPIKGEVNLFYCQIYKINGLEVVSGDTIEILHSDTYEHARVILNKEEEVTLVRYDKDAKQIIIGTALVKSI